MNKYTIKLLASFIIISFFIVSCGKEKDVFPVEISPKGNFEGTWFGSSNLGTIKLHDLILVDDPDSENYKVTGYITLISLQRKTISSGDFDVKTNILKIRANDGSNYYTLTSTFKTSDKTLSGTWSANGNSGTWKAENK